MISVWGFKSGMRSILCYVLMGYTFTAWKGLSATDGMNTPASEGLSSTAGVSTSLVRASWGNTAGVGT